MIPMLQKALISCLFFLPAYFASAQVTFVIESLPRATQGTDTIFICGSFNNWVPNDPALALKRQLNGQLAVTVMARLGTYEYKFTRGSWTKVETSAGNRYTDNRTITFNGPQTVSVRIDNWLDLGGARQLNYMIFYFFACAFQAIALCLLACRIQKKERIKLTSFLVINAVFTVLLTLLVLLEIANQIWQSYFTFIIHVSLFCWGPLVLYFIHSFSSGKVSCAVYRYFIPAGIAFIFVIIRLLNLHVVDFMSEGILPSLTWASTFFIGTSFLINLVLYRKMLRQFPVLKPGGTAERDPKSSLIYYFYWISFAALLLIPVNVLLIVKGPHHPFIEDFHVIAVMLSALIFVETYFLWRYPEIIREEKTPALHGESSHDLAEKLSILMTTLKPYKKADLTVSDLAEILGTKPHVLSRVINDTYQKNFRDFVNTYRIEEFIALADTKEFRHYTFLALAQEVGFNSKSTFNLAFKKLTSRSPREYLRSRE